MDDAAKLVHWDYIVEVLKTFRDLDTEEELYWRFGEDGEPIFWVLCSDLFHWASADGEDLLPEDLPLLRQCIEDLKKTEAGIWELYVGELFASRKRGMRPMSLWLQRLRTGSYGEEKRTPEKIAEWNAKYGETHERLYQLFLATGPERTRESEG